MLGVDGGLGILSPKRVVQAFAAGVTVAGLWLTGGLEEVPQTAPAAVVVGRPVDVGPYRITLERAVLADHLPEVSGVPKPGERWIGLVATVEVTANETRGDLARVVQLEAPGVHTDQLGAVRVFDMADGREVYTFQPGLTRHLALVWSLEPAAAAPDTVTVRMDKQEWAMRFSVGVRDWLPAGSVSGDVTPTPAPAASTGDADPTVLALGREVSVEPYVVRVDRLTAVNSLPGMTLTHPGDRWLGMVAHVRTTDPAHEVADIVPMVRVTVPGRRSERPIVLLGTAPPTPTQPREVILLWELRSDVKVPASAVVEVLAPAQERSPLTGMVREGDPQVKVRGVLAIIDKTRGAAAKGGAASPSGRPTATPRTASPSGGPTTGPTGGGQG